MTATPSNYLRKKTGTLTINSQDMGHLKVYNWKDVGEYVYHNDVSDGVAKKDIAKWSKKGVEITGTIDEVANFTIFAMLLHGTVSASSFKVDANEPAEWTFTWQTLLEDAVTYLRFRHDKCVIEPTELPMDPGDTGEFTGMPIKITLLYSASGVYGDFGKWDRHA